MPKSLTNETLWTALVTAGLIDDPSDVARVLIDIRAHDIPRVYVEKFGHPDNIAALLAAEFGPDNLVKPVDTSAPREEV